MTAVLTRRAVLFGAASVGAAALAGCATPPGAPGAGLPGSGGLNYAALYGPLDDHGVEIPGSTFRPWTPICCAGK